MATPVTSTTQQLAMAMANRLTMAMAAMRRSPDFDSRAPQDENRGQLQALLVLEEDPLEPSDGHGCASIMSSGLPISRIFSLWESCGKASAALFLVYNAMSFSVHRYLVMRSVPLCNGGKAVERFRQAMYPGKVKDVWNGVRRDQQSRSLGNAVSTHHRTAIISELVYADSQVWLSE
uniref:Cauli_VI domain-containing protein n=1 Tax=Panagrellus redivivus TaxID=6233 RepID=A0A7E4UPZ5_PANRE